MGLKKLYTERYIQDIADAIREANGKSDTYKVSEMAGEVIAVAGSKINSLDLTMQTEVLGGE